MKKNKKQYKKQYSIFSVIYTAASIVLFILSICCFFYLWSAYKRQEKEEKIAEVYIEELLELNDKLESQNETVESEKQLTYKEALEQGLISTTEWNTAEDDAQTDVSVETYTDGEGTYHEDRVITFDYYDTAYLQGSGNVTYVPSYAEGQLAFVLEYPKCGLRRGVYVTATSKQTDHNLNMWMTVLINPAMQLDLTSITIKGHNHTSQNLSWNQVKNASIGDHFTIYASSGVYIYEVTDIFVMPRSVVEESLDNDLTGYSSDTCFLVTCGRANFPAVHFKYLREGILYTGPQSISEYYTADLTSSRYQDFVVEGHIVEKYSLTEYGQMVLDDEAKWRE